MDKSWKRKLKKKKLGHRSWQQVIETWNPIPQTARNQSTWVDMVTRAYGHGTWPSRQQHDSYTFDVWQRNYNDFICTWFSIFQIWFLKEMILKMISVLRFVVKFHCLVFASLVFFVGKEGSIRLDVWQFQNLSTISFENYLIFKFNKN